MNRLLKTDALIWSLPGPICLAIGIALITTKGYGEPLLFTLAGLVGLALSWQWGWRGFLLSLPIIGLGSCQSFPEWNDSNIAWQGGFIFSMLFSLFITSLSAEEMRYSIDLAALNADKLNKEREEELIARNCSEQKKLQEAQLLNIQLEGHLKANQDLLKLAKDELLNLQAANEKQQKDMQALRQAISDRNQAIQQWQEQSKGQEHSLAILRNRIEETETELTRIQEETLLKESRMSELNEHIETLEREKDLLERTLARLQTELESLKGNQELHAKSVDVYAATILAMKEREDTLLGELEFERQSSSNSKASFQEKEALTAQQLDEMGRKWFEQIRQNSSLQERLAQSEKDQETLKREVSSLQEYIKENNFENCDGPADFRRMRGLYLQLREQFEEKSSLLDETRKQLFHTNETLLALRKEKEEWELENSQYTYMQEQIAKTESEFAEEVKEQQQEIDLLMDLVNNLVETDKISISVA